MATKFEKPVEASQLTPVADMPPLHVITEGIPAEEHIEIPSGVQPEAAPAAPERRGHRLAWALAGVVGLLLVVAGIFALTQTSSTGSADLHMGLTQQAWQELRAGERVSTTPVHMGLTLPAWQELRAGERAVAPVVAHMGLTPEAWQELRAGERAVAPVVAHMGLTPQAWQEYRAGEQVT